jgi:hypothetical protein
MVQLGAVARFMSGGSLPVTTKQGASGTRGGHIPPPDACLERSRHNRVKPRHRSPPSRELSRRWARRCRHVMLLSIDEAQEQRHHGGCLKTGRFAPTSQGVGLH